MLPIFTCSPALFFFLDVFLSNRGLLSHIAHSSRPLSAASTASSSFAPSQWQSGPVALMNAVINSRTHSLFRPLKLLLSASNSTTRHLCCYSICAPRQACACECQPMCVCVFVCTGRGGLVNHLLWLPSVPPPYIQTPPDPFIHTKR